MAETIKAEARRIREGFFDRFCQGKGIDIGCGSPKGPNPVDVLRGVIDTWDIEQGDATFMLGVPDDHYDFAYSSHLIEHLDRPDIAVQNWLRIVKPGGFLILFGPHRDRYERRTTLPSRFNGDHRTFWLPDRSEPPCTLGLVPCVGQWLNGKAEFVYCKTCDEGWAPCPPEVHAAGEYSIEAVWRKL